MNLNTGNLVRREINIFVMLPDSCMPFQKIWPHIYRLISMFYTSMLMRMFHWDHGLLDLMSSILMIGDYVVAHHLIASGRPKPAMSVLLPLIGPAVEFASLWIGLKRFIGGAGKERMLCGVLLSNGSKHPVFFLTQEDDKAGVMSIHGNRSKIFFL